MSPHGVKWRRPSRVGLAAAIAALLVVGCGRESPRPPNIVLIVVDTLRHDHVGVYGAARDTTPRVDAFSADAIRFERAYATAPWTQPSVASMLTGLYPSGHGLTRIARLPDVLETLPERLSADGYATAAVVSHVFLSPQFGFEQGFDHFEMVAAQPLHRAISSRQVTKAATAQLKRLSRSDEPFFLFVHYFDPHYDYRRHPAHGFAGPGAGRLRGGEGIERLQAMIQDASAEEISFIVDLYDEEVRHTDQSVGELLEKLRLLALYDDALIVLTADHGEEFMDHGLLGHAKSLYEELMRVPLIVRMPGGAGGGAVIDDLVSLAALTPTLLEASGRDVVPEQHQVHSLLPLLRRAATREPSADHEGSVFLEVDFDSSHPQDAMKRTMKQAMIVGRYKLIRDGETGAVELYDLDEDPRETRNLVSEQPAVAARLGALLSAQAAWVGERGIEPEDVEHTEAQLEALRALGYVD